MADDEELDLVRALDRDLAKSLKRVRVDDKYYEGEQPLKYMVPALEAEVGDRVAQLVVNFPRIAVEAYEHRLDIDGFRTAKATPAKRIREWWQVADGDELSQLGNQESIALARSYAIVGAGDDPDNDPPILSIEHPLQVVTKRDPRTRSVTAALKRWQDDAKVQCAQLYTPDATITFERRQGWTEVDRDDHELGVVPVVPLVNYPRVLRPDGRSEFHDVIPLADGVNKMATDMMVSGDFHAMPRRWALGFTEDDFVDENGNKLTTWSQIAGRIWGSEKGPDDAALGQFPEASLENFHNSIRLLAQLIGQLLALPAHYVNFTTENPPSAEGVKASESRTIKRAERKQSNLSGPWEQVVRIAMRIVTGRWEKDLRLLETIWRDPATPTRAQEGDAAVKLVQAGVIPREQAWEDLHYTDEQKQRMRDWLAAERAERVEPDAGE